MALILNRRSHSGILLYFSKSWELVLLMFRLFARHHLSGSAVMFDTGLLVQTGSYDKMMVIRGRLLLLLANQHPSAMLENVLHLSRSPWPTLTGFGSERVPGPLSSTEGQQARFSERTGSKHRGSEHCMPACDGHQPSVRLLCQTMTPGTTCGTRHLTGCHLLS